MCGLKNAISSIFFNHKIIYIVFFKRDPFCLQPKLQNSWAKSTESLDEAFSGYSAVEVSKDLTDEILSEIYGSTSDLAAPIFASLPSATLAAPAPPSLADEIFGEVYGETRPPPVKEDEEGVYETIYAPSAGVDDDDTDKWDPVAKAQLLKGRIGRRD